MRIHVRLAFLLLLAAPFGRSLLAGSFPDPVGLQLESVSGGMHEHRGATLDKVHGWGFKYVELVGDYGLSPEKLKAELRDHGLIAPSAHFPYAKFRDDPEGLAAEAAALGLSYIGCPSIPQKNDLNAQGVLDAAAMFNRAGKAMAARGIKFFYHPHGYEFKPYKDGTLFDLLMEKTDPQCVHFQMDIFWIVHAGQDPIKLLRRYPDRWVSMHLKDMRKGAETGRFDSNMNRPDFVPLGSGQIDIVEIMRAAEKLGITSYFIEDESTSPAREIPQSLQFLRAVNW